MILTTGYLQSWIFPVAKTLGADHVFKVWTFKKLVECLNELELSLCATVDVTLTEVYDFGNWLFTIVDFSSSQDPALLSVFL
jgi:hypothetical protein